MSALLSPSKPVRTRFKVPGEGAYELSCDLPPPPRVRVLPPVPAPAPSTPQKPAPSPAPIAGGPLGLTSATKLSFQSDVHLYPTKPVSPPAPAPKREAPPSANGLHFSNSPNQAPQSAPVSSTAAPSAPSSSGSSIFSFRKLTGLGSSLSSKFSSTPETAPAEDPAQNVESAPVLRAPPRVATAPSMSRQAAVPDAVGPLLATSFVDPPSTDAPTSMAATAATEEMAADQAQQPHTQQYVAPQGVLAYNAADAVILLDTAKLPRHTDDPTAQPDLNTTLTLHCRSAPTAHALESTPEALRLLIGCANGEVLMYGDIGAAAANAFAPDSGKRSRSAAAVATLASVATGVNGTFSTSSPPHTIYNRDGALNSTRCVAVRWVPGTPFRFICAHLDGAILLYDSRFKAGASSMRGGSGAAVAAAASAAAVIHDASADSSGSMTNGSASAAPNGSGLSSPKHNARDASDKMGEKNFSDAQREREKSGLSAGGSEKSPPISNHRHTGSAAIMPNGLGQHDVNVSRGVRGKRNNPAAVWQIGQSAITDCEFSPQPCATDVLFLAVTGRDGYLRILDFSKETMTVAFRSYFGALLCVSWSPDGKYVAAGGEDDLVSIWCPAEERIVARLEGHTSWVSAVAWDAALCGSGRYRIGSAGQDAKLLLWDFALDMLHHRTPQQRLTSGVVRLQSYARDSATNSTAGSSVSGLSNSNGPVTGTAGTAVPVVERRTSKLARFRGQSTSATPAVDTDGGSMPSVPATKAVIVRAMGRAEVPIMEPVVAHIAHAEPLTDVKFQEAGVLTADSAGVVKLWSRPPQHSVPLLRLSEPLGSAAAGCSGQKSDLD